MRCELVEKVFSDGTKYTADRDLAGHIARVVDPNGTIIKSTYNGVGRVVSRSVVHGQGVSGPSREDYSYDGYYLGRLISAENDNSKLKWQCDSMSNYDFSEQELIGINKSTLEMSHNLANEMTSVQVHGSDYRIEYKYDELRREVEALFNSESVRRREFMGKGLRRFEEYGNGINVQREFDGYLRESSRLISPSVYQEQYEFDGVGNIKEIVTGLFEESSLNMVYNSLNCLTKYSREYSLAGLPSESEQYSYDNNLNITSVNRNDGNGEKICSFEVNSRNQYSRVSSEEISYDGNGNLVRDGVFEYTYTYKNELSRVKSIKDGLVVSEHMYDVLGRRIWSRTLNSQLGTTESLCFVYCGNNLVQEIILNDDGSKKLYREYVIESEYDDRIAIRLIDRSDIDGDGQTEEMNLYYYHYGLSGNVIRMTDENGNIVERYEYSPFGETRIFIGPGDDGVWGNGDDSSSIGSRIEIHTCIRIRDLMRRWEYIITNTENTAYD